MEHKTREEQGCMHEGGGGGGSRREGSKRGGEKGTAMCANLSAPNPGSGLNAEFSDQKKKMR